MTLAKRIKRPNKKNDKLPAKESEYIQWNKICVDIIDTYIIIWKGQKENLELKAVTMKDPVTGWSKIMQYNNKREISIVNLVGTKWLSKYPRPMEITYDKG